ncbi:MAG: right-handed parallel beta-helix repeat-containing protein [Actinomycetota bacterium]
MPIWTRIAATLAIIAGLLGVSTTAVGAAVIDVTTTADVVDGGDGVTSLREAFTQADGNGQADTIVLGAGLTYSLTDCAAGELIHSEAQDLTVEGNGATIEQTCADTRLIDKTGPNTVTLTLRDATLDAPNNTGVDVSGAIVRGPSTIVLDGVTITGVDAGFNGSMVEFDFGPVVGVDLFVVDSMITNNTGRAFINQNPAGIRVEGSTVSDHTGSAINLADGDPIEIVDSTIADNGGFGVSTSGQGNGKQPNITVVDSTIHNNGQGGIDCSVSCNQLYVENSWITDNGQTAIAGQGGGIVMPFFGQGFAGSEPQATIIGSTFSGNVADHPGGGLLIQASFQLDGATPTTSISNSTFDGNTVTCAGCGGGGLAIQAGNAIITSTDVTGNDAPGDGGGLWFDKASNDNFDDDPSFSMTGGTVSGNTAGLGGGGLYVHSTGANLLGLTISGNTAGTDGGGLEVGGHAPLQPGSAVVSYTTISGNTANGSGGGATVDFPDGSEATFFNSTFSGNEAVVAGGATATSALVSATFESTTVAGNTAPQAANIGHSGQITVNRSVIAEPLGGGTNCDVLPTVAQVPSVVSGGFSWASDASCSLGASDVEDVGGDPQLGPLADNGGLTLTRLPAETSPLVDLVPIADCIAGDDQRMVDRPQGTNCEPGSVEIEGDAVTMIEGTGRSDRLVGTPGNDEIRALGGNDLVNGRAGDDRLLGGAGNDLLFGGRDDDHLIGGRGNDVLVGGPGDDVLDGGPGRDILIADSPGDVLDGGPGRDLCFDHGAIVPRRC